MNTLKPDSGERNIALRWLLVLLPLCLIIVGPGQRDHAIANPKNPTSKDLEMSASEKRGLYLPLTDFTHRPIEHTTFFNHVSESLDKVLRDLEKQLDKFSKELRKIPESQEFKRLEREWKQLLDKIKRAERQARDKIQKEILTRLRKELEKLREKLQKFRKKKEVKPLEV